MRNSNKILLIAVACVLALVVSFVLVMGFTARNLFEQRGRTVLIESVQPDQGFSEARRSTIDLSFDSTALCGSCISASSNKAIASS